MSKKTGKKAAPEQQVEKEASGVRIRPNLETYVKARSASGKVTHNCGDEVAELLTGLSVEDLREIVGAVRKDVEDADTRFAHLNVGQQVMNLRNMIRHAVKKEMVTLDGLRKAAAPYAKARDQRLKEIEKSKASKKAA